MERHLYMHIDKFQEFVNEHWTVQDEPLKDLFIMSVGLAGETGEMLEHIKKHVRDGKIDKHELKLEMGDVLHYWFRIAQVYSLDLSDIMDANVKKLKARRAKYADR